MFPKFILFFVITTSVFSQQEIKQLSLKEAVDFALQNNSLSKNAARDVEIAKLQNGKQHPRDCHKLKPLFPTITG